MHVFILRVAVDPEGLNRLLRGMATHDCDVILTSREGEVVAGILRIRRRNSAVAFSVNVTNKICGSVASEPDDQIDDTMLQEVGFAGTSGRFHHDQTVLV